jgi:hypothetical protein
LANELLTANSLLAGHGWVRAMKKSSKVVAFTQFYPAIARSQNGKLRPAAEMQSGLPDNAVDANSAGPWPREFTGAARRLARKPSGACWRELARRDV